MIVRGYRKIRKGQDLFMSYPLRGSRSSFDSQGYEANVAACRSCCLTSSSHRK